MAAIVNVENALDGHGPGTVVELMSQRSERCLPASLVVLVMKQPVGHSHETKEQILYPFLTKYLKFVF
jgi:hypothetical protein